MFLLNSEVRTKVNVLKPKFISFWFERRIQCTVGHEPDKEKGAGSGSEILLYFCTVFAVAVLHIVLFVLG